MPVKPSWKKLETYLVILGAGGMLYELQQLPALIQQGLPPQYAGILGAVLSAALPSLVGFFAKLRHDAYANIGQAEPAAPAAKPAAVPQ